ncbi:hypothetical protein BN1723_013794 [Verticillium longisporum]|uniref:Uncharacterized protein n=1 Tax=Verticillium longisporum TaxID=100787 RepID=A0A0G4LXB4_VERLO|nr:hypothetical protein BN1723_013794 [Verticillium longisporum]
MDHLQPPNSNNNNPEDDPPPPYEEVAPPNSPRPGLATQGLPRPHSSHNPDLLNPSPSHSSIPQLPSRRPRSSSHLSPYPGQAAQAQRPARTPQPNRPSTSYPGNTNAGPPSIPRQFPPAFNVYLQGFSRTMILAENQAQPIYALRAYSGFAGDASLILHSGPTERHPPLATLDFAPFSLGIVVTLPPSPIPGVPSALSLDPITGFAHGGYSFTIDVGTSVSPGSSGRWPLEEFQWRRSRGDAVASLGGRGYGWKLVRLAGGPPPGADQQWRRAGLAAGAHRGSDGAEVVAVWSEMGYSMSKALRFAFLGMGLTGLLGERWAIMAVMTAMGLFERERRSRQRRRF